MLTFPPGSTAQTVRMLTVRLLTEEMVVEKKEIASQEASSFSMMPEGLLANMTKDELVDAIMRSTRQAVKGRR